MKELHNLQRYIYEQSIDMTTSPVCLTYYVTTGTWTNDENIVGRAESEMMRIRSTDLFSNVTFTPIDNEKLKTLYREIRNKIVREIEFERVATLPKISGVKESYLGIIPCKDFLSLIRDSEDNLLHALFYDNVRDFQGKNPVNNEIAETIQNDEQRDKFALLNNGITIVAKNVNKVGTTYKINDFQVVNGCQTSHILHRNSKYINDLMYLPLKLIVTDNQELTNKIIMATNRQTEIKEEAFESLSTFHKKLEEYYSSFEKDSKKRLYYERRSKQYDSLPVPRNKIISLSAQIKSFISMFFNEPHSTHRYYGELLKSYEKRIFEKNHKPDPYYASGYGLYLVDSLFKKQTFDRYYSKFKYHILFLLKDAALNDKVAPLNSNKIQRQSKKILNILWDEEEVINNITKFIEVIQETLDDVEYSAYEAGRRKDFTSRLIHNYYRNDEINNITLEGIVDWFNDDRGFGIIKVQNQEYFVHYSGIRMKGYKTLKEGNKVRFLPVKNGDRDNATNVTII